MCTASTPPKARLATLTEEYPVDAAHQIAEIDAVNGDNDRAFEWIEKAYALREPGLINAKAEEHFESLHADPRWKAFLRKLGVDE